jgi:hypothetical protein
MASRRTVAWIAVAAGAAAAVLLIIMVRHWRPHWSVIQGAVIRSESDPRKRQPIAGAEVTASYGSSSVSAESDTSGFFRIAIPGTVLPGQTVELTFQHPGYNFLELPVTIRIRSSLRELIVAAMSPTAGNLPENESSKETVVSNIRVRYTVNSDHQENVGSEAKTFEVVNQGNLPCRRQSPCSPNGLWKASRGSIQIDAGTGNEFRDARATCIAGPCPFTRIDASGLAQGGRVITVTALDWSDTATFLVQAEVFRTSIISEVRISYPVVFGGGFSFTVPPTAEGTSLMAELGGIEVVSPLGPDLDLSWATCAVRKGISAINFAYQCELKQGYGFSSPADLKVPDRP